jgi:hypothetical protein
MQASEKLLMGVETMKATTYEKKNFVAVAYPAGAHQESTLPLVTSDFCSLCCATV